MWAVGQRIKGGKGGGVRHTGTSSVLLRVEAPLLFRYLPVFCLFALLVTLVLRLFLPLASLLLPPSSYPLTGIIICKNPRARYGQKSRLEAEVTGPGVATAITCSSE